MGQTGLRISASFNWEAKSQIEYAKGHAFESSCIHCHQNNYPLGLTDEGREAHLYYEKQDGELHCINCHITVGHYDPDRLHEQNTSFGIAEVAATELYTEPGVMDGFNNFTEYIPGSSVSFEMVAIPGGTFQMGSPEDEPFRNDNEGPVRRYRSLHFLWQKLRYSWDEYLAFFKQTGAQGKNHRHLCQRGTGMTWMQFRAPPLPMVLPIRVGEKEKCLPLP